MKNFTKLVEYIQDGNKYIFVNDFSGWGQEADVEGFKSIPAMEGNGFMSLSTGKEFIPQYASMRRGNHLEIQFRSRTPEGVEVDERAKLGDLFPNHDIVIITNNESLQCFAPVIKKRSEIFQYIALLQAHLAERRANGMGTFWNFEGDMMDLAIYLYQNHPEKEEDKSVYDRI